MPRKKPTKRVKAKSPLTPAERKELLALMQEWDRRQARRKFFELYPEEGPLRRELYKPQLEFFKAGAWARERAVIGANGTGKTWGIGGYEVTCHLTGKYPDWWEGRRFNAPVSIWVAGDTNQTVRDVLQTKLLGPIGNEGTGLIPGDCYDLKDMHSKSGVPGGIETVLVKHESGGKSELGFKSYDQGRRTFQGTEKHVIWLDEECPPEVYDECLMRTRTVNGMTMLTFTPIMGLTQLVLSFMPGGLIPEGGKIGSSRFVVNATWEDAPHLSDQEKQEIIEGTLPHLRDARSKGIPTMGSGAVYPISEDDVSCDEFKIPAWYRRVYGLDYGWNWTAAGWGAYDPDADILYIYNVYKRGKAEPPIHAAAIAARGDWIPGVADPSKGTSQRDGKGLLSEYQSLLGVLLPADNAVEAGIFGVWERMTTGRLKVFKSCRMWFDEFRLYRRDEMGKIVKENDHLMDCTRYMVRSGINIAQEMPDPDYDFDPWMIEMGSSGRNAMTGY